jgi:hypothetical protein
MTFYFLICDVRDLTLRICALGQLRKENSLMTFYFLTSDVREPTLRICACRSVKKGE